MGWFTGGIADVIGDVAKEWITTDKESAEAKAIMVKTLDPNGNMRRDLSRTTSYLYVFYVVATTILIFAQAYGVGDPKAATEATEAMTSLFMPITTAFGAIISASFGVNFSNTKAGK